MGWRAVSFLNPFAWFSRRAAEQGEPYTGFTASVRNHTFKATQRGTSFTASNRNHTFKAKPR